MKWGIFCSGSNSGGLGPVLMLAEVLDVALKDRFGGLGNHVFPQDFISRD